MRSLTLRIHRGEFVVHRLAPDAAVPAVVLDAAPVCIARTTAELSIVCSADVSLASQRQESGWRLVEVAGPLEFSETGILSRLTAVLADAGISVFAWSTFDTDYLMVQDDVLDDAVAAWSAVATVSELPVG